jgi:hypothetical protein
MGTIEELIKPAIYDKRGPGYTREHIDGACKKLIMSDNYFYRMAKQMTIDAEKAIELSDDVERRFSESLARFTATERRFSEESKKAGGNIRDAANKLADGLAKIEKTANFDRLERYVELLERAAKAIDLLSELDKSGRLSKIAEAIK